MFSLPRFGLSRSLISLFIVLPLVSIIGCAGNNPFHQYARAGDTIAIATGWHEDFSRDRMKVWLQAAGWNGGAWTEYGPNHDRIRAVVKMYPDPVSSLVVSNRTGTDVTPDAESYGSLLTGGHTNGELDWYQTVVFFDLPSDLPTGNVQVYVENLAGTQFAMSDVEIVGSGGLPHDFSANTIGDMNRQNLAALERASHYTVSFSGNEVPHALQMDFTHTTGVGTAYVVDPISGVKSMSWNDDGTNLRVIIMPVDNQAFSGFNELRFYIAGGITGLTEIETTGYNINGEELTTNPVSASVVHRDINIDITDPT